METLFFTVLFCLLYGTVVAIFAGVVVGIGLRGESPGSRLQSLPEVEDVSAGPYRSAELPEEEREDRELQRLIDALD